MISVAHDPTSALALPTRAISSLVLGDFEVTSDVVMEFPTPIFGFPSHDEYALLPATREGLWWMQSMKDAGVTFLLADPFVLDPTYGVDLGDSERAALHIEQPTDGGAGATANFRAPIVFNLARRTGMQVVSRDEAHDLRRPVTLEVFPPQENGVRLQ
jgi:flagellar assembly factor FliW